MTRGRRERVKTGSQSHWSYLPLQGLLIPSEKFGLKSSFEIKSGGLLELFQVILAGPRCSKSFSDIFFPKNHKFPQCKETSSQGGPSSGEHKCQFKKKITLFIAHFVPWLSYFNSKKRSIKGSSGPLRDSSSGGTKVLGANWLTQNFFSPAAVSATKTCKKKFSIRQIEVQFNLRWKRVTVLLTPQRLCHSHSVEQNPRAFYYLHLHRQLISYQYGRHWKAHCHWAALLVWVLEATAPLGVS